LHRRQFHRFTFLLLGLTFILGGCAFDGPQSIFDTVGPVAEGQAEIFMLTFWFGVGVFAVVTVTLLYTVWRYRRRGDEEGLPEQIHGVAWLEVVWTLAPVVILIIVGIATVRLIFAQEASSPEEDALKVTVTAYQWWWAFEYPELGIVTANELRIPVGRKVQLELHTADVIHSFWVPRLAGKVDNIPNQTNRMWLLADEPGVYRGQCAEYCGVAHAYMRFQVVAEPEDGFNNWVASFQDASGTQTAQADPLILEGRQLFSQKGCAGCHAVQGVSQNRVGPSLTSFGLRRTVGAGIMENTPENLARWISDPHEVKPGNYMPDLFAEGDPQADEEVAALVAYLQNLGDTTQRAAKAERPRVHDRDLRP